jgi:hypothetical protein
MKPLFWTFFIARQYPMVQCTTTSRQYFKKELHKNRTGNHKPVKNEVELDGRQKRRLFKHAV